MDKAATFDELESGAGFPGTYGVHPLGPGVHDLYQLIREDAGMHEDKRTALLNALNNHDIVNRLLAGVAGAAVARAIEHYKELSQPARILLGMAGFGIGNIIYDIVHKQHEFTTTDPTTGRVKIKL